MITCLPGSVAGGRPAGPGGSGCRTPLPPPRDLWQVSAARSPDRSSGLEFIWVTATGVVCCDKRLMGRALGAAWGAASGGAPAAPPAPPHGHPLSCPCPQPGPCPLPRHALQNLHPGTAALPLSAPVSLTARARCSSASAARAAAPGPFPTAQGRTGPGPQPSGAGGCSQRCAERKKLLSIASCSCTFLFNIHAPK